MSPRVSLLVILAAGLLAVAPPMMAETGPARTDANGVCGQECAAHSPGNAAIGRRVFIADCGRCHAMKAANATGTVGPNLDQDAVSYTNVVTAVLQGVGGIQAEYIVVKTYGTMSQAQRAQVKRGERVMTFSQLADVAKFVSTARS